MQDDPMNLIRIMPAEGEAVHRRAAEYPPLARPVTLPNREP